MYSVHHAGSGQALEPDRPSMCPRTFRLHRRLPLITPSGLSIGITCMLIAWTRVCDCFFSLSFFLSFFLSLFLFFFLSGGGGAYCLFLMLSGQAEHSFNQRERVCTIPQDLEDKTPPQLFRYWAIRHDEPVRTLNKKSECKKNSVCSGTMDRSGA